MNLRQLASAVIVLRLPRGNVGAMKSAHVATRVLIVRASVMCAFSAAILCVALSTIGAQETVVRPGDQIRFHVGAHRDFNIAELVRLTSDSLILERCEACVSLSYSRSDVNDLAVFRTSNRGDRLLTGLLLGALVGGGLGALSAKTCTGYADRCELEALNIPLFGIAGAFFGGAIGFMTGYRWVPVR